MPGEELIKAKDKQDKKLEEITLINLITLALVTSLLAVKKNSPDVPLPGSWQTWPHFLSSLIYLIYVELILMRNLERSRGDQEFDSLALHRQLVKGQLVFPSLPEKPAEPALAVEDEEVKPEPIIDEAEKAALPPAKTKLTDKIKRRKRKK